MPGALLVVSPALLLAGGPLTWLLLAVRIRTRWAAVALAWAALGAFVGAWLVVGRASTEVDLVVPSGALTPGVRIDPGSFAIGVSLLSGYALLLTFQGRRPQAAALASLAAGAAATTLEASSLLLLAVAAGTCAMLLMACFREEGGRTRGGFGLSVTVGAAALLASATAILAGGGTTVYSATPVSALTPPVFVLLAIAAMSFASLVPWMAVLSAGWRRQRPQAAAIAGVLLVPLGLFFLLRTYLLGGGSWPGSWLHGAVGAVGALTALGAAVRAQGATGRCQALGELPALAAGVAAAALSVGSPLSIAAGVTAVAAAVLGVVLVALLTTAGRIGLLGAALAVGVPPGILSGAMVLTIQACLEAGGPAIVLVPALALVWLLGFAAIARAARLPAETEAGRTQLGGAVAITVALGAGALLGPFAVSIGLPVAAGMMTVSTPPVTTATGEAVTASGGWGALSLGIIGTAAIVAIGAMTRRPRATEPNAPPEALIPVSVSTPAAAAAHLAARVRLQSDGWDRVLTRFQLAAEMAPVWFWAALALVLAVIVTR